MRITSSGMLFFNDDTDSLQCRLGNVFEVKSLELFDSQLPDDQVAVLEQSGPFWSHGETSHRASSANVCY